MNKVALVAGVVFAVVAVAVLVFADGLRRWYSGVFFAIAAAVIFANVARPQHKRPNERS